MRSLPCRVRRPTEDRLALTLMTLVVAMQGAFAHSRFCYLSLARLVARVEHGEGVVSTSGTIRARAAPCRRRPPARSSRPSGRPRACARSVARA
jgi:hypothetical protein